MRSAEINRTTAETDIRLTLNIDGNGVSEIDTGCGFLNHMLTLFARHGDFDLTVNCKGDVDVDYHHTAEDIGICLGTAFKDSLGDMKGIMRYASTILPMDESLILSAVDVSGRSFLAYTADIPTEKVGDFDTELVREFFEAFVRNAGITLHIKQLDGYNSHHIIEGMFKSVARSMKTAVSIDEKNKDKIPSTKGVL
jgi:imidazoleglycerol-phosphate dehydratase